MTRQRCEKMNNNNKGFTLVELIVVLVIMVILLSVSILGILAWQDWSNFKKANTSAETIFYALENQFTELDASDAFDSKVKSVIGEGDSSPFFVASSDNKSYFDNKILYADGSYYKWEPQSDGDIAIWKNTPLSIASEKKKNYQGSIYCISAKKDDYDRYLAKDSTLDVGTKLLFDCITPYISDTSVLNGAIWAEFSLEARQVFSVGYSSKVTEFAYNASSSQVSMLDRTEATRRNHQIGYYCAESLSIGITGKDKLKLGSLVLDNSETLELIIKEDNSVTDKSHYVITVYPANDTFMSSDATDIGKSNENKSHIIADEPLMSFDFTLGNAYSYTSLSEAAEKPVETICTFFEGTFTDEKKPVRLPVYVENGNIIHIVLDAADVQAQSFLCADKNKPEDSFINTYSFYRFGLDATSIEHIGCSISPDGDEDNNKYSNTDCPTFGEISSNGARKEYDILNGRHLYNMRYETDYKENSSLAAGRDFILKEDVDWAEFTGNNLLGVNYYLTSYKLGSIGTILDENKTGINYDGMDHAINKATVLSNDTSDFAFPGFRTLGLNDTFKGVEKNGRHTTISNLYISFSSNMRYGVYGKEAYLEWVSDSGHINENVKNFGKYDGVNTTESLNIDWANVFRFDTDTYAEMNTTHAKVQKGLYPLGLFAENLGTIEDIDLNNHKVIGLEELSVSNEKILVYTNMVGGFVGNNLGEINNVSLRNVNDLSDGDSFANEPQDGSHINGKTDVGGVIGRQSWNASGKTDLTISQLKNYAKVTGMENVGGIVGRAYLIREFSKQGHTDQTELEVYHARRLLYDDGYDIYGEFTQSGDYRAGTSKSITGREVTRLERLTIDSCISHGEVCGDDLIYKNVVYLYENDLQPVSDGGTARTKITYCMDFSNATHVCANIGGIAGITMDGIYYDCKNFEPKHQVKFGADVKKKNGNNAQVNEFNERIAPKLKVTNCNAYRIYETNDNWSSLKSSNGKMKDSHIKDMIQHDFYKGGLIGYCRYTVVENCNTEVENADKGASRKQFVFGRNYVGGLFGCFDFSTVSNTKTGKIYNIINTNDVIGITYVGGFCGGAGVGACKMENLSFRHPATNTGTQPSQLEGYAEGGTIYDVKNEGVVLGVRKSALDNEIIKKQDVVIYKQEYSTGTKAWQTKLTDEFDAGVGGIAGISRLGFENADSIQSLETKKFALSLVGLGNTGSSDAELIDNFSFDQYISAKEKCIYGGNGVGGLVGISIEYGRPAKNGNVDAIVYGDDIVGGITGAGIARGKGHGSESNEVKNSIILGRDMVGGFVGVNNINGLKGNTQGKTLVCGRYSVGGAIGEITDNYSSAAGLNNVLVKGIAYTGGYVGVSKMDINQKEMITLNNVNIYSKYFAGGVAGAFYSQNGITFGNLNVEEKNVNTESMAYAGGLCGFYNSLGTSATAQDDKDKKIIDRDLVSLIAGFETNNDPTSPYSRIILELLGNNPVLYSKNNTDATIKHFVSDGECVVNAKIGACGLFGHLPRGLKANINCQNVMIYSAITSADKISGVNDNNNNSADGFSYSGAITGKVPENTTIRNAIYHGSTLITSSDYYGWLAEVNNGTMDNCNIVTMTGYSTSNKKHVGGICALNNGTISNNGLNASITVSSASDVGLACAINKGTITNTSTENGVTLNLSSVDNAGGITGVNETNATIKDCTNRAVVSGSKNAGGIAGETWNSTIEGCANYSDITGVNNAAGIVGSTNTSTTQIIIKNCCNTGKSAATSSAAMIAHIADNAKATFELCRNYGQNNYTLTATSVNSLGECNIHNCLEAGGNEGADAFIPDATGTTLTRNFFLKGTSSLSEYDGTQSIDTVGSWPVNLKSIVGTDGKHSIVFERDTCYIASGINGVDPDPSDFTNDRYTVCQSMDSQFITMVNDTSNHPNYDENGIVGFLKQEL